MRIYCIRIKTSFKAVLKVLTHTWVEDVDIVFEPHHYWVDETEKTQPSEDNPSNFELGFHASAIRFLESLQPFSFVLGKAKCVMFLVHQTYTD